MERQDVKYNIENYLRYGRVFNYALKKDANLYINKLSAFDYRNYWFEYEESDIVFYDLIFIDDITTEQGDFYYVYISDFKFTGKLCYSDEDSVEHNFDIFLKATIRVFTTPDFNINISNHTNHIEIWDLNQKIVNLSYYFTNKKLSSLDIMSYDFEYYTKPWSKINKTSTNLGKQSYVTSYYYLQELIECYMRLKHLLGMVLLNNTYSNNYTTIKEKAPSGYGSEYMIQFFENFQIYDRYYLLYSELTIESFYKYWERVGFYLFQFFKPLSKKITERNLSFQKLITELSSDSGGNKYLQNQHFDWFVDFVMSKDSEFEKLTTYRHPFVHFKVNDDTGRGIGSLIANVLNAGRENMFDEKKLKSLESDSKQILIFLLDQFDKCKLGYEHMIELVKLLPDEE